VGGADERKTAPWTLLSGLIVCEDNKNKKTCKEKREKERKEKQHRKRKERYRELLLAVTQFTSSVQQQQQQQLS